MFPYTGISLRIGKIQSILGVGGGVLMRGRGCITVRTASLSIAKVPSLTKMLGVCDLAVAAAAAAAAAASAQGLGGGGGGGTRGEFFCALLY